MINRVLYIGKNIDHNNFFIISSINLPQVYPSGRFVDPAYAATCLLQCNVQQFTVGSVARWQPGNPELVIIISFPPNISKHQLHLGLLLIKMQAEAEYPPLPVSIPPWLSVEGVTSN